MALTAAENRAILAATKAARADAARNRRASGGLVYRKVAVNVTVIELPDQLDPLTGERLRLATSDASNERGRYFRVWLEGGRWKCRCGAFLALNGCHHVGFLNSLADTEPHSMAAGAAASRERN